MSHPADAASDHDTATVQLLKLFHAAVFIALVHMPQARPRGTVGVLQGTLPVHTGNLCAQRYIEEVLEPVVTLRNKPRQRIRLHW